VVAAGGGHARELQSTEQTFGGTDDLWIGGVFDACSRSLLAHGTCMAEPTAKFATRLKADARRTVGRAPRHSISDQGAQFTSRRFQKHLSRLGTRHRYCAVGKHGSIALLERFWLSLKSSLPWTWCIFGTAEALQRHVSVVAKGYNTERPHTALRGATPDDKRRGRRRRARDVPEHGRWKLTVIWIGPLRDFPIVLLRNVA
jgi:transposase InsO family protein